MDRNRQHIRPRVEDLLRAVAVMGIDVENGHTVESGAEPLCHDGSVIDVAET
jgi:hypothetical protein